MSVRIRTSTLHPLLTGFVKGRAQATKVRSLRQSAILDGQRWLNSAFLSTTSDNVFEAELIKFIDAIQPIAWHRDAVTRKLRQTRFAVTHLVSGCDPLPAKLASCVLPSGSYSRAGFGLTFWSACAQALLPRTFPGLRWPVLRGLRKLGLVSDPLLLSSSMFTQITLCYQSLLSEFPSLTAFDLDDFFQQAANLDGRELGRTDDPYEATPARLKQCLRTLRTKTPLRKAIEHEQVLRDSAHKIIDEPKLNAVALREALKPFGVWPQLEDDVLLELHQNARHYRTQDDLLRPTFGRELLESSAAMEYFAVILSVLQPKHFPRWSANMRRGVESLSDGISTTDSPWQHYLSSCEVTQWLRRELRLHPAEVEPFLQLAAGQFQPQDDAESVPTSPDHFHGFSSDTFHFLAELEENNHLDWMNTERRRYTFAVKEPLTELCQALASRYIVPMVNPEYGWELETDAKPGRALMSVVKNDHESRSAYQPVRWIAFYRKAQQRKQHDAQLAVRFDARGVWFGFHLGAAARQAGKCFRSAVQQHGSELFQALQPTLNEHTFEQGTTALPVTSPESLRAWSTGKELRAGKYLPANHAKLRQDELVHEILLTFDRLLPLLVAAYEAEPLPHLLKRLGCEFGGNSFGPRDFQASTFLSEPRLARMLDLLRLKKQLILEGVPGTGKTHVARQLARVLTNDLPGRVRMVQFHPGYAYEEFVEGLRPGDEAGKFTLRPGLLVEFATQAAKQPSETFVLIVDEINRGNLPRIFGELLFCLEYRDQEVTLPYSQQLFRLPPNLILLATMNQSDHSALPLDLALRRRFSFVRLEPDAAVLAAWLEKHLPADASPHFGPQLVRWFDETNTTIQHEVGAEHAIGHSYFMVTGLTRVKLYSIWHHQLRPMLEAAYGKRSSKIETLTPEHLMRSRDTATE